MPRPIVSNRIATPNKGTIAQRAIGSRFGQPATPEPQVFTPAAQNTAGSYTFTPARSGYYKFVLWGGGSAGNGGASQGGASGAYAEKTVYLSLGQSAALSVGATAGDSTATFPDGRVVTASGAATSATTATATGGDVNLNGSPGNVSASGANGAGTGGGPGGSGINGGSGAPANLPYRGGFGAVFSGNAISGVPGGGGTLNPSSGAAMPGGHGLIIVSFVR